MVSLQKKSIQKMMNFVNTDNINLVCVTNPALYISCHSCILSSTISHPPIFSSFFFFFFLSHLIGDHLHQPKYGGRQRREFVVISFCMFIKSELGGLWATSGLSHTVARLRDKIWGRCTCTSPRSTRLHASTTYLSGPLRKDDIIRQ